MQALAAIFPTPVFHQCVNASWFHGNMNDERLIRLGNLREHLRTLGSPGPAELARRYGKTISFWSDLMRGNKSFGEKLARELEEKMGMQRGALDLVFPGSPMSMGDLNGFEGQLVTLFRRLPVEQQHDLLALLDRRTRQPAQSEEKTTP